MRHPRLFTVVNTLYRIQTVMLHELYVLRTDLYLAVSDQTPYRTGWDRGVGFMDYGDYWRMHRRHLHQHFRLQVVHNYHPQIAHEVRKFLALLATAPASFLKLYRQ